MNIKDERLERALRSEEILIADGAMGTMLQASRVLRSGELCDMLCLSDPYAVTQVHRGYVEAGADIITTNTFNSNRYNLGQRATVKQAYAAAAQCARLAGASYVAGDLGPVSELMEPYGDLTEEEAYETFVEQAQAIRDAECDLVLIETMTDAAEAEIAVRACKEFCDVPVFATCAYQQNGHTFMGSDVESTVTRLISAGADAIGANCSLTPDQMVDIAARIVKAAREASPDKLIPVIIQPNAGQPNFKDGETSYDFEPQEFAKEMERIHQIGATILGSCCGTTPEHTKALAQMAARQA